jgi:fructokinase
VSTPRVLVVGEALIDIVDGEEIVGGSPANVALGLGRLGRDVRLLTALADDARGRRIVAHLQESGVHVLPQSRSLEQTSTAHAQVRPDGSAEYRFEVDWRLPGVEVPETDLVHVGSIACFREPGASTLMQIVRTAAAQGARITFDPNTRPALVDVSRARQRVEEIARLSTAVKLSDEDADLIYPGLSIDAVMDRLLESGPDIVAVTRGGAGAVVSTAQRRVAVAAPRVDVVDTVGAGDTFMAALIDALLDAPHDSLSDRLETIAEFCITVAAVTVGRAGADLPRRSDLENVAP